MNRAKNILEKKKEITVSEIKLLQLFPVKLSYIQLKKENVWLRRKILQKERDLN